MRFWFSMMVGAQVLSRTDGFVRPKAGLHRPTSALGLGKRAPKPVVEITTLEQLDDHWNDKDGRFRSTENKNEIDYDAVVQAASVLGDTQNLGAKNNYTHPVVQVLHERRRRGQSRNDGRKVALSIEGGGMRGCVSAGMICAVHHLNLTSCLDVVYGSSAGTVVGSYLMTGQLPWFGPEVYYDQLTTAGRKFIDTRRLLRALGLGLLDPRLIKDVIRRRGHGKPVLNLSFLLKRTVQETKPLDWEKFKAIQKDQPLKIVASGLKSEKAMVLDMESGAFSNLEELTNCMHASCLLPGIAGPLMNLDTRYLNGKKAPDGAPKFILGNGLEEDYLEPMADALVYQPIPYRAAIDEGCTHVLVVRSRPDGTDVTGKGGFFERLIFRRFFLRKNKFPSVFRYFSKHLHKKVYAEDVLRLNKEARTQRPVDDSAPHLMAVAVPPGSPEISRLETRREAIFDGFRRGFARAYDCLVEDPAERGRGMEVARQYFPDEILDYDPLTVHETDVSAFEVYMKNSGVSPKSWATLAEVAQLEETL